MQFATYVKRIFKSSFLNLKRHGVASVAGILVMVITLFIFSALIFANAMLNVGLAQIEERVDINIYFYPEVTEDQIAPIQQDLEQIAEVREVLLISREDALTRFQERHADNELITQSLAILDSNPLSASLNIQTFSPDQYASVVSYINDTYMTDTVKRSLVEQINYRNNEDIIKRLGVFTTTMRNIGAFVTMFFVVLSVIIMFNTMRLVMHGAKEEISVMRMVGAENKYIRGPFVLGGALYGIIAGLIVLVALYPITIYITKHTAVFFGGLDVFNYYMANLPMLMIILLVSGVILGSVSSLLAMRRYLKV